MRYSFPDSMVIQASRFGPAMTARQSIHRARQIILDLEKISPWRRPYQVSGCTKETGDMPIAEDLSDFDEVVMRALLSYDDTRYYNEADPENWKLTPDSFSPYGFNETFANVPSSGKYQDHVSVSLRSASVWNQTSLDDAIYVVKIPYFGRDEFNADWSDSTVVYSLFDYFIDNYDPMKCLVFGSYQAVELAKTTNAEGQLRFSNDDYTIGWLNYTRIPDVAKVFARTGKAVPYRTGTLLKLGDDASVLSDPKLEAELVELRQMLRAAGVNG